MARKYSSEYKNLQPYVVEDIRKVVNAAGASGGGASGVTDHGALTGLSDDDHPQYLTPVRGDARYIPSTRTLTAGAGLTGGGDLSADRTFTVGAGYGITVNADDIALASSVAGNGLTYSSGVLAVGVSGLGLGVGADAVTLASSSSPGAAASILATTAGGLLTLYNGAFTQAAQSAATFASGFAGSGWRADYSITTASRASMETDDLTVRGRMRVYELLIQQIRATNGSVFVSSASKVVTATGSTNPLWTVNGVQLTFNGANATLSFTHYIITTAAAGDTSRELYHGFLYGDIIRAQQVQWNGVDFAGIIQSNLEVTYVTNLYTYTAALVSGDVPAIGYDYVRLGNTYTPSRRGSIYLTSDDSAAPFIDIVDEVQYHADWNTPGKIKARLGKLSGISDVDFGGPLSGYGLYSGNVYLKGNIYATSGSFTGTLISTSGNIGGWRLEATSLTAGIDGTTVGLDSGGTNPAFYAGSATPASAPFRVTKTGALTATSGTIGGWTLGATSLTAGSGAATVGLDSGGTNPAFYAGSATPGSAPFRVTNAGALTASNATIAGDFSVASSTFGTSGVQMQYNAASPRFYVGDGANSYLKYEAATGYPIASGIYIQGASYVTGSVYAGNSAIRLSTNGMTLLLDLDTSPNIPSSTKAVRWFPSLTTTWNDTISYCGYIGYKNTSTTPDVLDINLTSVVGDTDNTAGYSARVVLQAGHYAGHTYTDANLVITREAGAGGRFIDAACDTFYFSGNAYVTSNMSALSITDRTPFYDGDAVAELKQIKGKTKLAKGKAVQELDHNSLPSFARARVTNHVTKEEHDERDLGAMVSMLTKAVQQLDTRLEALEL